MTKLFKIGLSGWIIQDGNYPNFKRGDQVAFAIEFFCPEPLSVVEEASRQLESIQSIGVDHYQIVGKVIHVRDSDWWALDAGILMYREQKPPPGIELDCWVTGEVRLGVDPFFYVERLSRHHTAPPLIYDWRVERIEIETTPVKRTFMKNGTFAERDYDHRSWQEIAETDAWRDEERVGMPPEYVLHCELLDHPPRR
jgi:hypothetical protein